MRGPNKKGSDVELHWHLQEDNLFSDLPEAVREDFLARSSRREIRKKEFLFFEDDPGEHCYYLETGAVRIFRFTAMGKEPIIFIRKAGEIFGLAEVLDGQNRKCNAQAVSACVVHALSKADLETLLECHPAFSRRLISILGKRVRYLGEQVENLMVGTVATRLMKIFLYLSMEAIKDAGTKGEQVNVPISLSQADFASLTGSCQQTISETMKQLQAEGFIRMNKREIVLLNPEKLLERLYE